MAELNTTKQNRLYKGKVVFKWEDNPGHHCGICAKPFSKDSCKVTCIGKHAEPCYRFHQILHFLGKAHECSPCITSDQMHYNRLKEVLVLVRKIKELDDADVLRTAPQAKKVGTQETGGMRRRHSIAETTTDADSETLNDMGPKLNKRERKRQRRSDVGSTKSIGQLEVFTKEDIEFIDWAIHLSEPDTKDIDQFDIIGDQFIPLGRAEYHEDNKENAINDANLSITPLKQKDSNTSLPTPNSILTRSNKFRYFGKGSQKHARKNGDLFDGLDPSILDRLGVEITTSNHSSQRKDLIAKLIGAIKNDIEVIDRENSEAKFREIAFFRWAGKTCKDAMDEAHKNYDWQTGLLKKNSNLDQESIELDQVMVDPSYSETPSASGQQMVAENVQQVKKTKTPVTLVIPKPTSASKPVTAIASSISSTNKNLEAWNVPMSKKSASVLKITVPPVPDVPEQSLDSSWTTISSKNKVGKRIPAKKEPKLVLNKGEDALEEADLKFLLKVRSNRK